MSWLCKLCETENPDDLALCEVCGSISPDVTPVINSFYSLNKVYVGEDVELVWEIEYATEIYLNGIKINEKLNKTSQTLKDKVTIFKLEGRNGNKVCVQEIKVEAFCEPRIKFCLSSQKIAKDSAESVDIEWDVQDAFKVFLIFNGIEEEVCLIGTRAVFPESTTIYELKVIGLDSVRKFTSRQILKVLPQCSIEFVSDKLFTLPDVPIRLLWKVQNAKSVELRGHGVVNTNGEKIVTIYKDTTFELIVSDAFGEHNRTIHVKLLPLPIISGITVPIPHIKEQVIVQNNITNIYATISPVLYSNMALPRVVNLKAINIDIPKFHSLQMDIGKRHWWNGVTKTFEKFNSYLRTKIESYHGTRE